MRTLYGVLLTMMMMGACRGQGTIRYVNLGGIQYPSAESGSVVEEYGVDNYMDFNNDGITDITIRTRDVSQYVVPDGDSQVVGVRNPPPDSTSFSVPLAEGTPIGPSLVPQFVWAGQEDGGIMGPIGPFLSSCNTSGCSGLFIGETGYLGVSFDIDGATHYGWVHLSSHYRRSDIHGFAYNIVPGEMILAGQVPEPSAWALLAGGGIVLWITLKGS